MILIAVCNNIPCYRAILSRGGLKQKPHERLVRQQRGAYIEVEDGVSAAEVTAVQNVLKKAGIKEINVKSQPTQGEAK